MFTDSVLKIWLLFVAGSSTVMRWLGPFW